MSFEILKLTEGTEDKKAVIEIVFDDGYWYSGYRRKFVEKALSDAWVYHETRFLDAAIQTGLSELLEEDTRQVLAAIMRGEHKRKGHKPNKLKSDAQRRPKLWARVNYWRGRGLPLWDEVAIDNGKETALSKAAAELFISPETARKEYQELNRRFKGGDFALMIYQKHNFLMGESEKGKE